jgi:hypothetical protein
MVQIQEKDWQAAHSIHTIKQYFDVKRAFVQAIAYGYFLNADNSRTCDIGGPFAEKKRRSCAQGIDWPEAPLLS